MTEIRKRAFVGLLGLGLISIGCGSSGGSGTGGTSGSTGGSTGTGGTHTTGTGGTTGGTGGTTGGAGSSGSCAAPAAALITDFSATGTPLVSAPYKGAQAGLVSPTVDTSAGNLAVTIDTGVPSMAYPYAYVGLPLKACANASAYTGVKFNISGTLSAGCTIQFSAVDEEHSTPTNSGTCTTTTTAGMSAGCYASSEIFTLPATATDVSIPFASQTGGGAGDNTNATPVDPTELLNVQWQVNVATGDAGGCTGNFTVNNVSFY